MFISVAPKLFDKILKLLKENQRYKEIYQE